MAAALHVTTHHCISIISIGLRNCHGRKERRTWAQSIWLTNYQPSQTIWLHRTSRSWEGANLSYAQKYRNRYYWRARMPPIMTVLETGCGRGLELCKGTWQEGAVKIWVKESLLGDIAFKLRPKRWTECIKLNKWRKVRVLGRNHSYKETLLVLQKSHIQHRCQQWDKRAGAGENNKKPTHTHTFINHSQLQKIERWRWVSLTFQW